MDRIKISSIIIARNEERNIERCIKSQLYAVSEIIVIIDDTTTDRTVDIVREMARSNQSIRYYIEKWRGYSATKQLAVSYCSNDWILWIDADEALSSELSDALKNFNDDQHAPAYSAPRRANFLGHWINHSGWYPGRIERLFNKHLARFSDKDVHEHLVFNGQSGKLNNDILHYTDPDIRHYFEKFNNYTSLAAGELAAKGRKAGLADILIRPPFLFFKMYILRAGFRDGLAGFILASFSSMYVFVKYCKLWEKQQGRYDSEK